VDKVKFEDLAQKHFTPERIQKYKDLIENADKAQRSVLISHMGFSLNTQMDVFVKSRVILFYMAW